MKRAFILSVIDQAILSILSLLLGLVLIRFASPEALGRYTLAMAVFFMFFSVQFSLVALPISTRIFGQSATEEREILQVICTFDLLIIVAGMVGSFVVLGFFGFDAEAILAGIFMLVGGLWRELSRSVLLARGDMRRLVTMDISASLMTAILIALLWQILPAEVACLTGLGLGTLTASLLLGPKLPLAPLQMPRMIRAYGHYFALTRWSLLGGISWELQNRAYVFIVQIFRGVAANGLLQASRLIVSPIDLVAMAWGRVAVPRMAALIRNDDMRGALRLTWINMALLTGFALIWCAALYLSWRFLEPLVFAGKYEGIGEIVTAWGLFMTLSAPLRCVEWIFQAQERFREVAIAGVINAIISLGLLTLLVFPIPLYSVLIILSAGIAGMTGGLFWLLFRGKTAPASAEAVHP